MFTILANDFVAIQKHLLAFTTRHAVLNEILVPIVVVPFEPDDLVKNPHVRSVYGRLYAVKRLAFSSPMHIVS